ncbi:valine--tRNA ligase [Rubrobacter indicoceani]|uniref:valine--tRNA ligase n=1 Tax=Rubrobacter indicoceani TaxID=2051957 RepID=UPI0013C424A0|nr:valine--tRNA ligase [Rubrobacter indicoceani]
MSQASGIPSEIPKTYDSKDVEGRLYPEWEEAGLFEADPNPGKEPYSIVIPPPNVTGALHAGHALNNTIQDALVRRARMKGYEALWLPGMDHASIALQNVVERKLQREENRTKWDIGREAFLEKCQQFADESRSTMLGQLRRMGASLDWRRLRFTMDEGYVKAVNEAFIRLYNDGLIYKGNRITNWCPRDRSAISDLEVNYSSVDGKLYGLRYRFSDGKGAGPDGEDFAQVFSTRPETMLGDVALVVNPDDGRYTELVGRKVTVPFVEREIEIFSDLYVDPEFGNGVLKVTPAHDPNDFEIGDRMGFTPVNVMNPDGTINENGAQFGGLTREEAREAIVAALGAEGLLGEVRDHTFRIGTCDRCGTVIEPWLSEQWWVSMKPLAEPAIEALRNEEITVYPDSWRRETIRWLENIHDWNVSRQLWWGHRIPVWYGPDGEVVASVESPGEGYEQDQDIMDTWFSSGLWPFATLGWPDRSEDLDYFYPTSLLSTGREIMYLWVARMIMNGLYFKGEVPFRKINVHSIVLAEDGTKMSKSRGNTINPLDLMDEYGTDAVRFGLLYQSSTQDFAYSYERAAMGRAFVTKLWNAMRFIVTGNFEGEGEASVSDRWIVSAMNRCARDYDRFMENCEFSEAMRRVYDFAWHEFADWYIEIAKTAPTAETSRILRDVFTGILRMLHPVMPFVTEEMSKTLGYDDYLVRQPMPLYSESLDSPEAERILAATKQAVQAVRSFRNDSKTSGELRGTLPAGVDEAVFAKLAGVKIVGSVEGSATTLSAGDTAVEIALSEEMRRGEIDRLRKEVSRVEGEVNRVEKKLANEKFVQRAPQDVVAAERAKLDANAKLLDTLKARLEAYL